MSDGKIRVAVVFGGRSGEHEVSRISATSVMQAIDKAKYDVIPIGITRSGRWLIGGDPMKRLEAADADEAAVSGPEATPDCRGLMVVGPGGLVLGEQRFPDVDVVFPVLHGPYGEDGTIQGLLEMADIAYVGAGVLGSALGMDKIAMKDVFRAHGLPVVRFKSLLASQWRQQAGPLLDEIEQSLGYPCFVKPANLGSSVGISKAHDRAELEAGLNLAAEYDRRILVEEGINAREIEVSVLGNDEPEASVPGEVVPSNEYYDYAAKYLDGESQLLIPAPLSEAQTEQVRKLAIAAFLALAGGALILAATALRLRSEPASEVRNSPDKIEI